jgi:hypothetical protein
MPIVLQQYYSQYLSIEWLGLGMCLSRGYMAGRLLTAYISLKGYAPVTRNILYEWVRRMLAVSSREKSRTQHRTTMERQTK